MGPFNAESRSCTSSGFIADFYSAFMCLLPLYAPHQGDFRHGFILELTGFLGKFLPREYLFLNEQVNENRDGQCILIVSFFEVGKLTDNIKRVPLHVILSRGAFYSLVLSKITNFIQKYKIFAGRR